MRWSFTIANSTLDACTISHYNLLCEVKNVVVLAAHYSYDGGHDAHREHRITAEVDSEVSPGMQPIQESVRMPPSLQTGRQTQAAE